MHLKLASNSAVHHTLKEKKIKRKQNKRGRRGQKEEVLPSTTARISRSSGLSSGRGGGAGATSSKASAFFASSFPIVLSPPPPPKSTNETLILTLAHNERSRSPKLRGPRSSEIGKRLALRQEKWRGCEGQTRALSGSLLSLLRAYL
ncbi:hypothetical protein COCNU_contig69291873G000010 [Cocos nucifera]|nr:hypothetical protein [Cocos nucifera]